MPGGVASLARYARVSPEALARWQQQRDPASRRWSPDNGEQRQGNGSWTVDARLLVRIGDAAEGLVVCRTCAAIVLASAKSMNLHPEWRR
jgi:hypothetical protein